MTTRNFRAFVLSVLLAAASTLPAWGQSTLFRGLSLGSPLRNSIQVQGVSAYFGYTSNAVPGGGLMPASGDFGGDMQAGGSTGIAWNRSGARGGLSGTYSLSYTGNVRYSDWNSLDHALSLTARRTVGRRWSASFTASGATTNLTQYLFSPTQFEYLASAPGTFEEFVAGVQAGRYSSDEIASLLTGVPVLESPARSLFYGSRVFSASAVGSLEWRRSPRFQVEFSGGAGRSQHLRPARGEDGPATDEHWMPQATAAYASAGVSYSVTPRTRIGVQANGTRNFSALQNAFTGTATFSAERRIGRHCFLDGRAGLGIARATRSQFSLPRGPQYVAGGTVGYRERAHTLVLSHERSMTDAAGLLAGSANLTSLAWNWSRPGRPWMLFCGGGQQRMHATGLQTDGWMFNAGAGHALGHHASVGLAYAYLSNSGAIGAVTRELSRHSVRLEIMWNPVAEGGR